MAGEPAGDVDPASLMHAFSVHRVKPLFREDFVGGSAVASNGREYWTSRACNTITFLMEPHHHHHPGHAHPPATVSPSILRLSALERLAAVAVLIAALWGAVIWAMAS